MSRNSVNLDLASRFLAYLYVPPINVQRPASPSNTTITVTLSSISYFKGCTTNVTLPSGVAVAAAAVTVAVAADDGVGVGVIIVVIVRGKLECLGVRAHPNCGWWRVEIAY